MNLPWSRVTPRCLLAVAVGASLLLSAGCSAGGSQSDARSTCGYLYTIKADGQSVTAGGCSGSLQEQVPGPEVHVRVGHDITITVAKGLTGLPLPSPAGQELERRRTTATTATYRAIRSGEVAMSVSTIYCNGPGRSPEPSPVAHTCPVARVIVD